MKINYFSNNLKSQENTFVRNGNLFEKLTFGKRISNLLGYRKDTVIEFFDYCIKFNSSKFQVEVNLNHTKTAKKVLEKISLDASYIPSKDKTVMHSYFSYDDWLNRYGMPNMKTDPFIWFKNFKLYESNVFDNVLKFTIEKRGLFLKFPNFNANKNYWYSGTNGGLTIFKKRDEFHESVFTLHDVFHYVFPDPLLYGDESFEDIKLYVAYRLMSEAFSLVMADIYSVFKFKNKNIVFDYDFSKRKIFPIFDNMKNKMDLNTKDGLEKLLYSVSFYIFTGDDKEILKYGPDLNMLQDFKNKYSVFFWQDLEWNNHNYSDFLTRKFDTELMNKYKISRPEFVYQDLEKLKNEVSSGNKIIFKKLFALFYTQLVEALEYSPNNNLEANENARIKKYLYGQIRPSYLYSKQFPKITDELEKIYSEILKARNEISYDKFCIKYTSFLDELKLNNVLDLDTAEIYKTSYPLFNPKYINYDKNQITDDNYKEMLYNYFGEDLVF